MLVSGLLLAAGSILVISLALDPTYSRTVLPFVGGLFLWISVFLLVPSLAGGVGLLRGKEWGRILILVVSVELLLALPLGTALGLFGLWTLLRSGPAGTTAAPFAASTAIISPFDDRTRDLLLAMAGVAAGFLILIGGGFLIFGGAAIGVSPHALLGAGVLTGAAAIALRRPRRIPTRLPAQSPASLKARPPAVTVLVPPKPPPTFSPCAHLQSVESVMRAAGIAMRSHPGAHNQALCRIHLKSFERRFGPRGPVTYSEFFQPERHAEDNPTACLACGQCNSRLYTLHPFTCSTETPWFPAAPPALTLLAAPAAVTRSSITAISVSPSGRIAAVASGSHEETSECVLWDTVRREVLRRFPLPGVTRALAWTSDERGLIAGRGLPWTGGPGSRGPSLFLFDVATGAALRHFGQDLFGVRGIAPSPDGRMLLVSAINGETAAEGSSLGLWDLASGRIAHGIAQLEGAVDERLPYFTEVAFTPDGRLILAGCDRYVLPATRRRTPAAEPPRWWNRGVRVWTTAGHDELDLLHHHAPVSTLSVSSDGSRLLAAGERFGVWNLTDGRMLWDQPGSIDHPAAASPDGRVVARGLGYREDPHGPYRDTAVELYDSGTGEFRSLGQHRTPLTALAFVPAEWPGTGTLLAGGEEGELRFWAV